MGAKHLEIYSNLSLRTYGLLWQGFNETSYFYKTVCQRLSRTSHVYEIGWQSFVRTSHFYKLKINLTLFSGWRLKPSRVSAKQQRGKTALTIPLPSLRVLQDRASFLLLLHKPKWVAAVEGERSRQERTSLSRDLAPLWTWACESALFIPFCLYRLYFCLESPCKVPKGVYISCVARKHHHVFL